MAYFYKCVVISKTINAREMRVFLPSSSDSAENSGVQFVYKHFPYCAIPLRKQANENDCARQIQHATANGKIAAGRSLFLTQSEEGYVF